MATDDPLFVLLDAAREGNDRALTDLVQRTQPAVWRLCASLGRPDDPADLVQETYLRALKAMHSFRGDSPVLPWLLSIARRTCADAVRRRQRQQRILGRVRSQAATAPVAVADIDPGDDELIARLHPDRREVFVLTQQLGLSYEEAAEVIGCPVGTVRSRLARARADLLDELVSAEAS